MERQLCWLISPRRLVLALVTIWAISVLSFAIIQLPPGDYVTSYIASMSSSGSTVSEAEAQQLRDQYGLDQPMYVQYVKWVGLVLQGNLGMAMEWNRPVREVIGDRLTLTIAVSLVAIIFTWVLALPIGIYSAVRRYSLGDYIFTFIGFIGLAIPGFMLALIVMYLGFVYFGANIGGLFSAEYADAPWSVGEARGPGQAHAGAGDRARRIGHCAAHPHHALQPAGRAAETVRDDGARQGPFGDGRNHEISGAGGAEPLCQHHRLPVPLHRLRQHYRVAGA